MKKEITKSQLRAALCYLVGWLTENSIQRVVACVADITAGMPDDCKDSGADILKAMLSMGWAKRDGINRYNFIWISTFKTPKLKDDESVTKAVDELWDAMNSPRRKSVEPEEGIEKDMDSLPEPVTEKACENTSKACENKSEEPFSIPWDAIKGVAKSSPEILVTMLREEGWTVTATKEITVTKEL